MNIKRGFGKRAQGMVESSTGSIILAVLFAVVIIGGIIFLFRDRISDWLGYFYDGIRFGFGS